MSAVNLSFLTSEDIEGLEHGYVKFNVSPDLASSTETGKVAFTLRGLHLFSAAAAIHGVQREFAAVSTWDQYIEFQLLLTTRLAERADHDLEEALRKGEIPLQERAAAIACLRGDASGSIAAERQLRECKAAGANVIPFGTVKR